MYEMFTAAFARHPCNEGVQRGDGASQKICSSVGNLPHQRDVLSDEGTLEAEANGFPRTCLAR
jgi:hypothetical protein